MNKIRSSIGAKIIAWILLTISVGVFGAGSFFAIVINECGAYTKTSDEVRKALYENVADNYSVMALASMGQDYGNTYFKNKNFHYGIIQAESLEGMDLTDENVYEEYYFTEVPSSENLYLFQADIGISTSYYYGENVFEAFGSVSHNTTEEVDVGIDGIGYSTEDGIYYYQAGGLHYPVNRVELSFYTEMLLDGEETDYVQDEQTYIFTYEPDRRSYRNEGFYTDKEERENYSGNEESVEVSTTALTQSILSSNVLVDGGTIEDAYGLKTIEQILAQEYLTFDEFAKTDQRVEGRAVYLDGTYYAYENTDGFYLAEFPKSIAEEDIANTDYYRQDNSTLSVTRELEPPKSYWVVSEIPQSIGRGWTEDMFLQANAVINAVYTMRYSIYAVLLVAFAIGLASLIFLFCVAGYRKNEKEAAYGWLEKLPFEIYTGITAVIGFILCMLIAEMGYNYDLVTVWFFIGLLLWCMCAISLLYALSFAVRIKCGRWWKNTLVYASFCWMRKLFSLMGENMSLLWKAGIIFAGISFVEMLVIVFTSYESGMELLLWLVEKVIIGGVLFVALIQMKKLQDGSRRIAQGDLSHQIDTSRMFWEFKKHGDNLNSIGAGMSFAVDERMKSERFKTELITNVSHDIKTPLTSIINYVDLLEKEELENENAKEYLEVLERQSARLKKLIEDLMEASKASTGNLGVTIERLEAGVFMVQTVGEFEEKTKAAELELIISKPKEPVFIMADGRHFWRVIDNLMNNICKYAQPSTRVYINLEVLEPNILITFRNTSKYALNISSEELMERFVRGDSSRNTDGSGLGLSIAQSLMELMNGKMELFVDGDLFKVVLSFSKAK